MGIQKYKFKKELKFKLIGFFGKLFIDLLFSTTKIESVGFEKNGVACLHTFSDSGLTNRVLTDSCFAE